MLDGEVLERDDILQALDQEIKLKSERIDCGNDGILAHDIKLCSNDEKEELRTT